MKNFKNLFIDADGTLLDFEQSEVFALRETFLRMLDREPEAKHFRQFKEINETLWKEFEEQRIDGPGLKLERAGRFLKAAGFPGIAAQWSAVYVNSLSKTSFPLPGAEAALDYFCGICSVAVITNGLTEVQNSRIGRSFISRYTDNIFTSEEAGYAKPRREYFDYVMGKMGISDKRDILIIGDGLGSDILGGNNSGIETVWINANGMKPRGATPGRIVSSLYEFARSMGMG